LLWGEPGRPAAGFGFSGAGVEPVAVRVRAKTVPERLKPDSSSGDYGTAEQSAEKRELLKAVPPCPFKLPP
jgi:hypothetical protein